MKKFILLVSGTNDIPTYAAGLLFAIFGLAFYYKSKVKKRNANSSATPYSFSLQFFMRDNISELIFSVFAILLLMRFSIEHMGVETTMLYSFGLGLAGPKAIDLLGSFQKGARK
jgi:hypothetical protein